MSNENFTEEEIEFRRKLGLVGIFLCFFLPVSVALISIIIAAITHSEKAGEVAMLAGIATGPLAPFTIASISLAIGPQDSLGSGA